MSNELRRNRIWIPISLVSLIAGATFAAGGLYYKSNNTEKRVARIEEKIDKFVMIDKFVLKEDYQEDKRALWGAIRRSR